MTVLIYNVIKNRMDEALKHAQKYVSLPYLLCIYTFLTGEKSGLVPNEDAPDIVANTFLEEVTEEQLDKIGLEFLQHHECKVL